MFKLKNPFTLKANTPTKASRRPNYNVLKKNIIAMATSLQVMDEWLDFEEIELIDNDAAVIAGTSLRKSATLKKELLITCENTQIAEELQRRMGFVFRQQALDTPLQGFSTFELMWEEVDGLYYPTPIERNYQDFTLKGDTLWYRPDDIKVPPFKAVHAVYAPKFNKPMGRPLYKTLFWLVKFKNASLEFWLEYMERFSSPWIVGSTEGDKNEMAENLYAMLAGDVAVIEEDDKVQLITPDQKGNFQELSKYADDQIRETLVGSILMGSTSGGSFAAAKEQNKVREDIAMTDEHILKSLIDQIILAFKQANYYAKDITAVLKDADNDNTQLSERDLRIHQMSGTRMRPTKKYLEETYKIELEEVPQGSVIPNSVVIANKDNGLDHITTQLPLGAQTQDLELKLVQQIDAIFANAESYEEAFDALAAQYIDFDTTQVEETLSTYIANAHLYGLAEVEDENPKG